MKELIYNNVKYLYKICINYDKSEDQDICYTNIYSSTNYIIKAYRKYLFFGPKINKKVYNFLFSLDFNINNEYISKEVVKFHFDERLKESLEINKRREEIKHGNILN